MSKLKIRYLPLVCILLLNTFNNSHASNWYVATNGNNSAGTNWSTAFTTLSNALTYAQDNDTVYVAGQTFSQTTIVWSARVSMTIEGGYAANPGAPTLPGANDPAIWTTILRPAANGYRVLYATGITNSVLKNVTVCDANNTTVLSYGMGLYVNLCRGLTLDTCIISNNLVNVAGTPMGGGLYINSSQVVLTNCVVTKNSALSPGGGNGTAYCGGLYLNSGSMTMARCRVTRNTAANGGAGGAFPTWAGGLYLGAGSSSFISQSVIDRNSVSSAGQFAGGAGIYNLGTLILANSIVDHNNSADDSGDGIYSSGNLTLINCTVADNYGVGIMFVGGTVGVTNTIVWGHNDDLKGFPNDGQMPLTLSNVFYTCTRDDDNNGRQNCFSIDPLFANTNYYHLQSRQGVYTNGYFNGGGWGTSPSNSPLIDAGNPSSDFAAEPVPNGGLINLGAYGNTTVASLSDITTGFTVAEVTNPGATLIGHRTARLNGQVTGTGGQPPYCWLHYWITGNSSTSTALAGIQGGTFYADAGSLTPGAEYQYYAVVSNTAGVSSSDTKPFTTHSAMAGLYAATNGNNSSGTNWFTAFTNLQGALDILESGDTLYLAGHSFSNSPVYQATTLWNWRGRADISILGGYAATSDVALPGANDPIQWPTTLRRGGNPARVLAISGITNSLMRGLTIRDGSLNSAGDYGAGLYLSKCRGLVLEYCTITNNLTTSVYGPQLGGGIYAALSVLTLTNCLITRNVSTGGGNGYGHGGGVYIASGVMTMALCRVTGNWSGGAGQQALTPDIGGIGISAASTGVIVRSVISGNTCIRNGGGIYSSGNLRLANCVIDHNNSSSDVGDGIYVSGGAASIVNCTLADNSGVGISHVGGSVTITNSILWNNIDDLAGTIAVTYCDIKTADSFWTNGFNGCISTNPLFADTVYYHEVSHGGYYTNGYFSGGEWTGSLLEHSPCIDAGDRSSDFVNEPAPKGGRINMGAYGNTDVASKSLGLGSVMFMK